MARKKQQSKPRGVRISNRKAFHDFDIIEKIECGMALRGTEVKSLRAGSVRIDEAYARLEGSEVYLVGANIALYPQAAADMQHDPTRKRKLLLHRRQIEQIASHLNQKGRTLVPLAVYFKNGWAKCELGIAEGKRQFDKRDALKRKQQKRDIEREMRRR